MTPSIGAILRGAGDGPLVLDATEAQRVCDAARAIGGSVAELGGPADKPALLEAFARGFAFPDWWGRNWDALEDLLIGGVDVPRLAVIVWHDPGRLAAADPDSWATACDILVGAIESRRMIGSPPLVIILTGEQPGTAPAEVTMSEPRQPASETVGSVPAQIRQLGKVHHVAVVVRSIDASLVLWRDTLGLPVELVLPIGHDRVTIAFLPVGESKIELVQPDDDTTGVARFLANKGEGFHHICFEVPNISETLMRLEMDGIELIDTVARKGAEGPVAFLHPKSCQGVLVELIEAPGGPAWAALGY